MIGKKNILSLSLQYETLEINVAIAWASEYEFPLPVVIEIPRNNVVIQRV
jgi:hypothetical protein